MNSNYIPLLFASSPRRTNTFLAVRYERHIDQSCVFWVWNWSTCRSVDINKRDRWNSYSFFSFSLLFTTFLGSFSPPPPPPLTSHMPYHCRFTPLRFSRYITSTVYNTHTHTRTICAQLTYTIVEIIVYAWNSTVGVSWKYIRIVLYMYIPVCVCVCKYVKFFLQWKNVL